MDEQGAVCWQVNRGERHRYEIGRAKHPTTPCISHLGGVEPNVSKDLWRLPLDRPQDLRFEWPNELNGPLSAITCLDVNFEDGGIRCIAGLKATHR